MTTTGAKIFEAFKVGKEQGPKELVEFYDKWVTEGTYDQVLSDAGYKGPITVASVLSKRIGDKSGKIIDIGSGTGLAGEALARNGFSNICAVDPSGESLGICRKKGVYKEYSQCLVGPEKLPFDDNSFAGACSSGVFLTGHCDGTSLKEIIRVVKPGGTIVLTTRRTYYDDHQDDYNLREVSDELVSAEACSLVLADIPEYSQGKLGVAMIYTVL